MHGGQRDSAQATIADGIARQVARRADAAADPRSCVDDVLLVGEDDIEQAILMLLEIEKTVVEGAGAVGLAALLEAPRALRRPQGRAGAVRRQHRAAGAGRDHRARHGQVGPARAPALRRARRARRAGRRRRAARRLGANIDEVQHQRAFTSLSVERAQIEVVVQTRGARTCRRSSSDARRGLRRRARRLRARTRQRRVRAGSVRIARQSVRS